MVFNLPRSQHDKHFERFFEAGLALMHVTNFSVRMSYGHLDLYLLSGIKALVTETPSTSQCLQLSEILDVTPSNGLLSVQDTSRFVRRLVT